ncbi:MAG: 1-(5-phosphoribosyl)-5-[(5-phosphoribosylamino)methylideneamino]imidazole-4-carboxamide isomerase [Thermodesulfovibrio sp.]|jgi:phosphoribosylformimino-5-aminoimidazole carboxamide ribotide isomerase|uniref:1-(5-phosphoribosyl)-5-[(5- phosphoribosylamino)methylideneamino]imidazole-4- carboxamide isomerase n=1 Tax=unclassified Thermodesulfovibrio TaxID=2645936 RepID=UPI00083A01DA|nr:MULTISPECIES: 1-(5-phosphoribosyl)-5-[(5-phosphoribosylamino)methylideneamino]imidazole-4-carboxamide isomerase [unclassified Thermodesulfovibrio]MDI1471064.1 1-(5-phosphoribosyl)-5-[(5-phosphoribosylamino)methylideneamino]imidazole-4-carboxamide isomerase [Thermodesulfovibrio sp. 1176]MDI6713914.1 1-(5-phosphoribosyl)-5-[(5-phosphoribosylamino)methylideneamino]imidazole-4-carboxamide isomerase [Thermodesulfovibrio sp.]ODA43695.1 Phosphoribosylformimino-5-aminoimidazole carboxamide ribotide i
MHIIPAIDLKDGKCVRLRQGKFSEVTVYYNNPQDAALKWQNEGAKVLHVVDLDGAFSGKIQNLSSIKKIRNAFKGEIEVGGGIRTEEDVRILLDCGIDRVILGTVAVEAPDFVKDICKKFPGKIIAGIDARDGYVAVKGWVELTKIKATELAQGMQEHGVWGIIYTDISRDGMLTGPNIEATKALVERLTIPVIASGGVSSIDDIKKLSKIPNLWGVIVGKALYEGTLKFSEAIELCWQNA